MELRKIKNPFVVNVLRNFDESIEEVFDAWVDPVNVGGWLFSTPEGENKISEVDPRVGGDFVIGEQRGDEYAKHIGTYHVIDRPNKIVFNYYYEGEGENLSSNVSVDFSEEDVGCLVSVTHEMDAIYSEYEENAKSGWNMIFDGLEKTLK